jgi:fatty acid desaturase
MGQKGFSVGQAEWPTVALLAGCYLLWGLVTLYYEALGPFLFVLLGAPLVTLHSSLQHEALHGHPTRSAALNEALVYPPLGLLFPYRRFKALHMKHHNNSALTDPYDDPESFYYALSDWRELPQWMQRVLDFNNTFFGRFTVGPLVMLVGFVGRDLQLISGGERDVRRAWLHHIVGLALVFGWTAGVCGIPVWLYAVVAYFGLSLLNLRTFAEHQAHESDGGRTAIVEASPFFGLLFLNNNLHFVHHESPRVPWYKLPELYRSRRAQYLAANENYRFSGYGEVIRRYLFRAKQPVPHPFVRRS